MRSEKFFCKKCRKYFEKLKIYEERHGFDYPPYEMVAVCPMCETDDYFEFDCLIEKIDVAEKILPVIMNLNRLCDAFTDIFGCKMVKNDLSDSVDAMVELICEMFEFLDVDMQKKILMMSSNGDMERIFTYLKGGL